MNKVEKLKIDVQGMREKILDLAMRGKLVSQDENDEPANVLLEKIAHEKEQLIKEKKIKKTKPLPEITDEEKPFDIPDSWEWVRLGDYLEILRGGSPRPIKNYLTTDKDGINWIKIGDTSPNSKYIINSKEKIIPAGLKKSREVNVGDFLLSNSMSFGRPYILKINGAVHDGWLILKNIYEVFEKDYLYYGIISNTVNNQFTEKATGSTVKNLNKERVAGTIIPLPPLNEQKRIAAKVEELFELLDIIEESTNNYENLQKELKEKILELGMQGKLVEQDIGDEPASKLYEQIQAEKVQLIKEKKIKKTKPLPEISNEEKPFDIPESWEWVRIGNIGLITSGGTPKTKERSYWVNGNIPWITPAVMAEAKNKKIFKSKNIKYINNEGLNHSSAQLIPANSLVMSSRAPIGYINIVPFEYTTNQGCKSVTLMNKVSTSFMYNALKFRVPDMEKRASGTTFKEISGTKFSQTILPLPPLNEQKRIATKIEELFNTIDN